MNELVKVNDTLGLDQTTKSSLQTWEDHLTYYTTAIAGQNSLSWIKADILLSLLEHFGEEAKDKFQTQVNESPTTVAIYVRTARAFPPEQRIPNLSFTGHLEAAMADDYKDGVFLTDNRFQWAERAADEGLSTRHLKNKIQSEKEKDLEGPGPETCDKCGEDSSNGQLQDHIMFTPGSRKDTLRLKLHAECYQKIAEYAQSARVIH